MIFMRTSWNCYKTRLKSDTIGDAVSVLSDM
ncbi:hypothetical protein SAMN05518847_11138 [Paenibacillus sp. OV219]|nr:hypothetical protein SAMN05518847_11138 [Paenibacillus sp. OV219]